METDLRERVGKVCEGLQCVATLTSAGFTEVEGVAFLVKLLARELDEVFGLLPETDPISEMLDKRHRA